VRQFGVTTPKQSPTPLMYASLYSSDNRCDTLYLRNYVTLNIKDELSRLVGIGDVGVYGPGVYSMRLWLDPNELASRNLIATDVLNAVHEQNVQVSAGQLGAEPSPKTTEFLLSIKSEAVRVPSKSSVRSSSRAAMTAKWFIFPTSPG
jgi:multidrug efflux pump